MNVGFIRATRNGKAGSSGLFCCALLTLALLVAGVSAEPIALEVVSAEAGFDQRNNSPILNLKLSRDSGRLLADISQKNIGRKADIRIGGRAVVSPVFREPILGGVLQVSDNGFTAERTRALAEEITAHRGRIEIEALSE
jgi:preprotein translocase subunit SecD